MDGTTYSQGHSAELTWKKNYKRNTLTKFSAPNKKANLKWGWPY